MIIQTLSLFVVTARETLHCDRGNALVAAEDTQNARYCMTTGSDSLWVSVDSCEQLTGELTGEFSGYTNCGAYVIRTW